MGSKLNSKSATRMCLVISETLLRSPSNMKNPCPRRAQQIKIADANGPRRPKETKRYIPVESQQLDNKRHGSQEMGVQMLTISMCKYVSPQTENGR